MIGIKIVAIALTGLGGATMGSDVYLSARARSAVHTSWQHSSEVYRPVVLMSEDPRVSTETGVADAPAMGSVIVLSPSTIYSRSSATHAATVGAPDGETALAPAVCSNWALHEDGVTDPGIWTLCVPSASP